MEQVIRQAHCLITKKELLHLLLLIINKCEEPSINLELAIGNGITKTMHELTNAIIKNKKLDKPI
jgi:hypothetical protein